MTAETTSRTTLRERLLSADVAITCVLLAVGVMALVNAQRWPFRASIFPFMTGFLLVGTSLLKLVVNLVRRTPRHAGAAHDKAGPDEEEDPDAEPGDVFATATRREWLSALAWMAAFFVTLWLFGALIGIPLFTLAYLLVISRESVVLAGSYALASWLFVYGLFDRLLHLPLPNGIFR